MATTTIASHIIYLTSDADFRSWGSAISTALQAVGLVKTADTGQINWTTVTRAGAGNTIQGYEIYRFDDALQATKPVYIKIEYGSGLAVTDYSYWVQVASGTNGAGTTTGQIATRVQQQMSSTAVGESPGTTYVAGGTNWVVFFSHPATVTSTTRSSFFMIERLRDSTGTEIGDGVVIQLAKCTGTTSLNPYHQILHYTGTVTQVGPQHPSLPIILWHNGSNTIGTRVNLHPVIPCSIYGPWNPAMGFLAHWNADITGVGNILTVPFYGSNHTYRTLGTGTAYTTGFGIGPNAAAGTYSLAMRWE